MDRKGRLLDTLNKSGLFTAVGWSDNKIDGRYEKKDVLKTLVLEVTKLSGLIEEENIAVNNVGEILRVAIRLLEQIELNKEEIARAGIRFHFLGKMDFKKANDFFIGLMSPVLKDVIKGQEYVDSAIVPIVNYGNYIVKYAIGPLKKIEYPQYFNIPQLITYDEGYFFDIDYYSFIYRSLRIDKFFEDAYNNTISSVNKIEKIIQKYAQEN